ncbi:hypothetical protein [Roseomonas sp. BN140053]|uniref:hypothetical protein n=1 Tax=Roseomonas sp. BN140053 TaxID=3391898 RepID=UPI0039EBEF4E
MKQAFAVTVVFDLPQGMEVTQRFALSVVVDTDQERAEARAVQNIRKNEPTARIRNALVVPIDVDKIQAELRRGAN